MSDDKNLKQGLDTGIESRQSPNKNEEYLDSSLRLENLMQEKFQEWRKVSSTLDQEKQQQIETLISEIEAEYISIKSSGISELKIMDFQEIENAIFLQTENMEILLQEKKTEILKEMRNKYDEKLPEFKKTIEVSKLKLKSEVINSLPKEVLNKKIKSFKIEDLINAELDKSLTGLGFEVQSIPSLINETEKEKDLEKVLKNLDSLTKYVKNLDLAEDDYLKSIASWNENAEVSSAIYSDIKEYEIALKFLLSDEGIETKIGLNVPKNNEYKKTNDLIKETENKILRRFFGKTEYFSKYKSASMKDFVDLKRDYENDILAQYIADTLNKNNIKFERNGLYDKEIVNYLLNPDESAKNELKREIKSDFEEKDPNGNRSFKPKFFEAQSKIYEQIIGDPELSGLIRINMVSETSGEKQKVRVDNSFYETAFRIQSLGYLNDPRFLNFKNPIDELVEMRESFQKGESMEEKRIAFSNKYSKELSSPEGLANLLYGARRLFEIAGNDIERFKELKEESLIDFELINNTHEFKGDKYKVGRGFLMTKWTYEERKKINADKMAYIDGITAINSRKELVTAKAKFTKTDWDEKTMNFEELPDKGKKWLDRLLNKNEEKESDEDEGFSIKDLFSSLIEDLKEIPDNLDLDEVINAVPESMAINDIFIENLETINNGSLNIESQNLIAKKKIEPQTLLKITLNKNYGGRIAEKYLEEAFVPELKEENIRYLKEIYKSTETIEDENSRIDKSLSRRIPKITNEKAILFISENMEDLKTEETIGIVKFYLEKPLLVDSSEKEKYLYKRAYFSTYRENLVEYDEKVGEKFNKFMISRNIKNILSFDKNDIDAMEFAKEKNPLQLEKALTIWLKEYGYEDINKDLESTGMNLSEEETRKKAINLLSIMSDMKSPETLLLKGNITKTINEQMGLSESFTESMEEMADIALGIKKADSVKQQRMAIDSFEKGIFKGENPKKNEMSQREFYEKLIEQKISLDKKLKQTNV